MDSKRSPSNNDAIAAGSMDFVAQHIKALCELWKLLSVTLDYRILNQSGSGPSWFSFEKIGQNCSHRARWLKRDDPSALGIHLDVTQNVIQNVRRGCKVALKNDLRIVLQIAFYPRAPMRQ